ncbi:MAG: hypothetical protein J0I48_06180 [Devosia sp.]|uniref:putative immunity protein n=1 Tax=Devosia sp. 66-22 TaxID=1895753 RepID=UPI00092BFE0F|nr:hypothetical protein [Devosia sp. 66-22]MBN9345783.1 hypothetical protein [Devosia sp.]OJX48068.1 MAG: hypothetical protein BGO81_06475 [Devosia sp. 66-22]
MRDRFVAAHRGGPLGAGPHRELMLWAIACAEHVLPLAGAPDERLRRALVVGRKWEGGAATTGEAMKASLLAHGVAQQATDPVAIAVARATGQAVATAHMADHSMGAALYAQRAAFAAGGDPDAERRWQLAALADGIRELITSELPAKARHFRM